MNATVMTAGLAATGLIVGAAVAGCGSGSDESSSTKTSASSATSTSASTSTAQATTSAAAQSSDYSNLLIKPADIVVPGDTFSLSQTLPVPNPAGVEGVFANQNGSRKIDDTIYVYPDAAAASQALDQSAQAIPEMSVKATPEPADVGAGGRIAVGPSPDGAKAKGIVMFTQGKAFAVLELESDPNDPVNADFLLDLGRKQAEAIAAGLPS